MEHEERAQELETDAEQLEERSKEVERKIDETESDWEAKQEDDSVPGAVKEGETEGSREGGGS